MGLDQYAYAATREITDVDFDCSDADGDILLTQWRKHADLQGWMERLYRQKGGQAEDFNLTPVKLDLDDLTRLEIDVVAENLPHTEGFFFGQSIPEDKQTTLEFIQKARMTLSEGIHVYYTSWW